MFKSNILSAIFGKAEEAEDKNSIITADEHTAQLEAEHATLKEAHTELQQAHTFLQSAFTLAGEQMEALTAKVAELEAQAGELQNQITTLTAERDALVASESTLKEELAKKPTGTLTTVIAEPNKEAAMPGDPKQVAKSFKTKADAEVEKYLNAGSPTQQ